MPPRSSLWALGLLLSSVFGSGSLAPLGALAKAPVSAPSSVEQTRLGPLQLENGYPSKAAAAKLYDEMDFQRATQAYLWALPAVGFKALYDAQAKTMGVRNGDVLLYRTLQDKAGMPPPTSPPSTHSASGIWPSRGRWWWRCRPGSPLAACSTSGSSRSPTWARPGPTRGPEANT